MKLEIELPDWVEGRNIYVMYGRECAAVITPEHGAYVKTVRCDRCGKCCIDPPPYFPSYKPEEGGGEDYCVHCEYDEGNKTWECRNPGVPFGCVTDVHNRLPHPDCCMRFEKR